MQLLKDLEFDFIGCGALNWDIFFEIEDFQILQNLDFFKKEKKLKPGKEIVLERDKFLKVLDFLEKNACFVFECGGGSAANTIYALGLWGFKCAFIGAVGKDSFGRKVLKEFEEIGVSTNLIVNQGQNSLALILLDENKDRFIIVSPGDSEKSLNELFKQITIFPKGIYHFSSFASPEGKNFQKALLSLKNRMVFSFDPGEIYVSLGFDHLKPWFEKTKYLFLTQEELDVLNKTPQELFSLGIEKIFVKQGNKGASLYTKDKVIKLPALKVKKILDNTGAGDYFNAGVLAGIKLGLRDENLLKLGIYSAGISLRNFGRKGCLNLEEFQKYITLLK